MVGLGFALLIVGELGVATRLRDPYHALSVGAPSCNDDWGYRAG